MFARVLALLPLAVLASASYLQARTACNSGDVSCCNSVQSYQSTQDILGSLGIVLADVSPTTMLGFTCNPISVIGVGSNSCTQQTVCCDHNEFNGLINVGCSPINVNL